MEPQIADDHCSVDADLDTANLLHDCIPLHGCNTAAAGQWTLPA